MNKNGATALSIATAKGHEAVAVLVALACLPAGLAPILVELGLREKAPAASRWCKNEDATALDDIDGDLIPKFVAALEPIPGVPKSKLIKKLAATNAGPVEKLKKLKELLDVGAITQKEFDAKKAEHLEKL